MQIQRKSNGSAALRIAGRLIFSSAFLLTVGGIAALVVSLLFCHACDKTGTGCAGYPISYDFT